MTERSSKSTSKKRLHDNDTAGPGKKLRRTSEDSSRASAEPDRENDSAKTPSKHNKKERKQNRSTRIHSLRKQLARATLPSTIQQEKERELAALLHEQDKAKAKQQAKKTLERYHYVRFVERQKAEKRLKQLRKQLQTNGPDEELSRKILEMEINRNYAIYAPLDQKYISIFAPKPGEDEFYKNALQDRASPKPPIWKVVEATMAQGQSALEALRDGKVRSSVPGNGDFQGSEAQTQDQKGNATALKNAEEDKNARRKGSDRREHGGRAKRKVDDASDGDMSDGGFFDR